MFTSSRFRTCSSTRRLTPLANSYLEPRLLLAETIAASTCFLLEFELFTATISCVDVISIGEQSYFVFVLAREHRLIDGKDYLKDYPARSSVANFSFTWRNSSNNRFSWPANKRISCRALSNVTRLSTNWHDSPYPGSIPNILYVAWNRRKSDKYREKKEFQNDLHCVIRN